MPENNTLKVQLEEYRALRSEILERVELQYRLTYYAATLFAGILTVIIAIIKSGLIGKDLYYIILLFPWIFYIFALAYREQDFLISGLGYYINNKLRPKIARVVELFGGDIEDLLEWDQFLRSKMKWSLVDHIRGNSRYLLLFLPNLVFLSIFVNLTPEWSLLEEILTSIDILLFIDPILATFRTRSMYLKIAKKGNEKKTP